ncbi:glycosyltransferase family 2 protein [Falsibacillus pallidus]|uniref:Glycosyltransferase involved in cell wall biosynthesis n=1 Tax=Falsibacillus pallidus TaxID=493781 RepID=A0A370GPQ4_9BACI|nr:glycosyltransferase family 2 protein [Falsibacillus pallidus]RDI45718.1 glycosyltransferase involved in cell wall biosynthesis [Falsibacillus pallidus]
MSMPLVSIIVPIYNVEKYIERCIKSILMQTYSNLEIILVNDGSPDNCGNIAEDFKNRDKRIKVLHKENGGLSDARNHGMLHATGLYTMFVDSDDWIEVNMVSDLVNTIVLFKADVVQSAFYYAYDSYLLADTRYYDLDDQPTMLNKQELMYELVVNERVKNFAWGKLYKTILIQDIPFKKGVLYEDVFWAHHIMHKVETFILLHTPLYNYYQREDSIVGNYSLKNLDFIRGLKERHSFIERNYQILTNESLKSLAKAILIQYNLILFNNKKINGMQIRRKMRNYLLNNYSEIKMAFSDCPTLQFQLQLFKFHPFLPVLYLGIKKSLRFLKFKKPLNDGLVKIYITPKNNKRGVQY